MKSRIGLGLLCAALVAVAAPQADAQIPIDTNRITGIALWDGGRAVLRVVVTNDVTVGSWQAGTEYWYASPDLGRLDPRSLTMTAGALGERPDAARIARFVDGFSLAFSVKQDVGAEAWSDAPFEPASARATLLQAADPDAPDRSIGLLLEQDEATGSLTAATWFKTFTTGLIFEATPERLSFEPVVDARGAPSLDPGDIDAARWVWFRAGAR